MARSIKRVVCYVLLPVWFISVIAGCTAQPVLNLPVKSTAIINKDLPPPSSSPDMAPSLSRESEKHPSPLLFVSDGQVLLASGVKTISLGKTCDLYTYEEDFNFQFSADGKYIYYISYNGNESTGSLMKVGTDASSAPERIAENICAAQSSNDGQKVLYVIPAGDTTGTLFLKNADEKPAVIAENVIPLDFGFSPGGQYIYYLVQKNGNVTLYIKSGMNEHVPIIELSGSVYVSNGINVDCFGRIIADDKGSVLCEAKNSIEHLTSIYIYTPVEKTQIICENGSIVKTFGTADEFLYKEVEGDSESLWYKAPEQDAVIISDNHPSVYFPDKAGFFPVEQVAGNKNDLDLIIWEWDNDLYGLGTGGQKTLIDKATSSLNFYCNPNGYYVIYGKDRATYIARKTASGWDTEMLSKNLCSFECFDSSGKNLYYIDDYNYDSGNDPSGPFFRYSLETGQRTKLMETAVSAEVYGDTVYATGADWKTYRIKGDTPVKLTYKVLRFWQGDGGIYLITDNDEILFAADGSDDFQMLCNKALDYWGYITDPISYCPPLDIDADRAIDILLYDMQYYLCQLDSGKYGQNKNFFSSPMLTLDRDISVSEALMKSAEVSDQFYAVFPLLNKGFSNCKLWLERKDEQYKIAAVSNFETINEYMDRMAQGGE